MIDKNVLKTNFFFLLGIFSVYIWNSILNLNEFFIMSFNNTNIVKIYTFSYFGLSIFSMPLTFFLDKKFSIFKTIKYFSFIMIISFNVLYFIC